MTSCHILREDPELAEAIPPAHRARARAIEERVAATRRVDRGVPWPGQDAVARGDPNEALMRKR